MTNQDRKEFRLFVEALTDTQLQNVLKKETDARRYDYAKLVQNEIDWRGR